MELANPLDLEHDHTAAHRADATRRPVARQRLWLGRALSALPGLFLLMDATIKLLQLPEAIEGSTQLGFAASSVLTLGVIELVCTLLYLVPRTAFIGALLLTGYLGGAVCTHLRLGQPLFSHTLFPVYLGVFLWAGLTLRDRRLEALLR